MPEKCILLVEDDDDQAFFLTEVLRTRGITVPVARARDGEKALCMLRAGDENGGNPTVVFLDLNMPGMGGLEVLQHIRSHEQTRTLPVVIFSSSVRDEDVRDAYLLGANSYVRKLNTFKDFSSAVLQLVSYWLNLNEPAGKLMATPTD